VVLIAYPGKNFCNTVLSLLGSLNKFLKYSWVREELGKGTGTSGYFEVNEVVS
jgi:hypothetical protein